MEAETVDGWWWLPGRAEDARFGRLAAGISGPWMLNVFGSLEENDPDLSSWFRGDGETRTAPVIHGHLVKGAGQPRFVSLLNCWQSGANRTLGGPVPGARTESWTIQEVVVGHDNVTAVENAVEVQVRLSTLLDWSGRRPPHVDWSDDRVSVSATSIDVGSAAVAGATIDLVLDHGATQSATEAIVRHQAMFRVTPSNPVAFHAAMSEFAVPLRALLSFLTLGHVDVELLRLRLDADPDDRRRRWFDYRTRLQRPFEEPKPPGRHEMLATWPDLEAELSVQGLVGGWIGLHREMEKAITLLLVPHHATYLYTDDHLLTAFVAMEAYHAARIGGTAVDPAEHRRRVDAIVAAAPAEYRVWANDMLRGRNQKGLGRKLKDIIELAGTTGDSLLAAVPRFVDVAVKHRGSVAHPGYSSTDAPGAEYLAVSYGVRWLLRHCLLVDLGLSQERAAELIAACRRFSDEVALARRWTARK